MVGPVKPLNYLLLKFMKTPVQVPKLWSVSLANALTLPMVFLVTLALSLLALNGYFRTQEASQDQTLGQIHARNNLAQQNLQTFFQEEQRKLELLSAAINVKNFSDAPSKVSETLWEWNKVSGRDILLWSAKRQWLIQAKPQEAILIFTQNQASEKHYFSSHRLWAHTRMMDDALPAPWNQISQWAEQISGLQWRLVDDRLLLLTPLKTTELTLLVTAIPLVELTDKLNILGKALNESPMQLINAQSVAWVYNRFVDVHSHLTSLCSQEVEGFYHQCLPLDVPVIDAWQILIHTPKHALDTDIERSLLSTLVQTLLALLGLAVLLAWVIWRVVKPLNQLTRKARYLRLQRFNELGPVNTHIREYQAIDEALDKLNDRYAAVNKYIPNQLLDQLNVSGNDLSIYGEEKTLQLLSVDINHFSQLSANFEPQAMVEYLSAFHSVVTEVMTTHHGMVNQFDGDRVLAYWGAPLSSPQDPQRACRAALDVRKALNLLNDQFVDCGLPVFTFRIALETGNAVVGNFGSHDRLVYSVIGRGVDRVMRLNEMNKRYGTQILMGDAMFAQVSRDFFIRRIDWVENAQGENHAVYELISWITDPTMQQRLALVHQYESALEQRQNRRLDEAEIQFSQLMTSHPEDEATVYQLGVIMQLKAMGGTHEH